MYEKYSSGDEFADDSEFDSVVEHTVPSARIPVSYMDANFELTPANTTVRLFLGESMEDYSRVIVRLDDGSTAPIKLEGDEFLEALVDSGFPVEFPDKPDETDQEFMDAYMRIWTEDASAELNELQ